VRRPSDGINGGVGSLNDESVGHRDLTLGNDFTVETQINSASSSISTTGDACVNVGLRL